MAAYEYLQESRWKSAKMHTIQATLLEGSEGFRRRESSQGLCFKPASRDFSEDAQHGQPESSMLFKLWLLHGLTSEKAAALDKARAARAAAQGQADSAATDSVSSSEMVEPCNELICPQQFYYTRPAGLRPRGPVCPDTSISSLLVMTAVPVVVAPTFLTVICFFGSLLYQDGSNHDGGVDRAKQVDDRDKQRSSKTVFEHEIRVPHRYYHINIGA